MKLYELIKQLLVQSEVYRNSDKALIWEIWRKQGVINGYGYLSHSNFMSKAKSPESIRRCRQKVQENCPELKATDTEVKETRDQMAEQKGTFVYRDTVTGDIVDLS